jgi:hypothetical protein
MRVIRGLAAAALVFSAPASAEPLSNQSIVALHANGLDDDTIIAKIQSSDANFDLSTSALVALKKQGVQAGSSPPCCRLRTGPPALPARQLRPGPRRARPRRAATCSRRQGRPASTSSPTGSCNASISTCPADEDRGVPRHRPHLRDREGKHQGRPSGKERERRRTIRRRLSISISPRRSRDPNPAVSRNRAPSRARRTTSR